MRGARSAHGKDALERDMERTLTLGLERPAAAREGSGRVMDSP